VLSQLYLFIINHFCCAWHFICLQYASSSNLNTSCDGSCWLVATMPHDATNLNFGYNFFYLISCYKSFMHVVLFLFKLFCKNMDLCPLMKCALSYYYDDILMKCTCMSRMSVFFITFFFITTGER
jgi:hypothetical protein